MWDTMEQFAKDKLRALKSPSFYGGRPVTELEEHRVQVIEDLLQEYRFKKARKILEQVK